MIPHEIIPKVQLKPPAIAAAQISAVDENKSLVSVRFNSDIYLEDDPPLVFVLGDKVFGYSDAPFFPSNDGWLRAVVPTALLLSTPTLIVKPLFAPPSFEARYDLNATPFGQPERIVLLEKDAGHSSFLLYGSRLSGARIVSPAHVDLEPAPDIDTLRKFDLTSAQLKGVKQILMKRGTERPILIALPANDAKSQQQVSISGTLEVQTQSASATAGTQSRSKLPLH
jgi:hypothetical protein